MKLLDLTGQRFGNLTVLGRDLSYVHEARWSCRCDCGQVVTRFGGSLRRSKAEGATSHCGCLQRVIPRVEEVSREGTPWKPITPYLLSPAYLAGIIDGEGSIFSRRQNPHVAVSNNDETLIACLKLFGGSVGSRSSTSGFSDRIHFMWSISGGRAAIILRACLPYLLIKQHLAQRALELFDTVKGSNHSYFIQKSEREMALIGWPS